ncbi:MAG: NADH-quinone oxidoreductase subunit L [Mycobacteriales bacterium]
MLAAAEPYTSASGVLTSAWLLLALPLLGAAVALLAGRRADRWAHLMGCATVGLSFVLALVYFFSLRGLSDRAVTVTLFDWINVGGFKVEMGLLYDPLSAVFVLLITGVGFLIHVYSVGYMAHDPGRRRFFGYMNLFVSAMLLLVLANSYLALYVGWEGVGLASYLLIAFWYAKPAAATAAKKAFIFNRVGDVGLTLAIFLMFATLGTTSFAGVFAGVGALGGGTLLALALLLLLGACGKSGQFPLQGWLPDAMEGPTPVSALIHAATMVTAGVYLIARSAPVFDLTQDGRTAVTVIGAVTLLIGSVVGCAKDDIKRVLAWSTVSQIGYMFLAVGLGPAGYAIGILHLLCHGFFKAGLFLGAGSVMHGMNDQVDMRRFGGLRSVMPVTFWTMMAGYLALIGMVPFSGFFSKDKIIEAAFDKGGISGWILGVAALAGAGLTAFYMTRLMVMTFFGKRRWTDDVHPHESPQVMTVPMIVLSLGSVAAGGLLVFGGGLQHWLEPSVGKSVETGLHTVSPLVLTVLTLLVVIGGAAGGWYAFGMRPVPMTAPTSVAPTTVAARNNLYADTFNEVVLMRPGQWLTRLSVWFDNRGVDGLVNGFAAMVGGGSGRLRKTQTGFVRSYALTMLGGTVAVVAALLAVKLG